MHKIRYLRGGHRLFPLTNIKIQKSSDEYLVSQVNYKEHSGSATKTNAQSCQYMSVAVVFLLLSCYRSLSPAFAISVVQRDIFIDYPTSVLLM